MRLDPACLVARGRMLPLVAAQVAWSRTGSYDPVRRLCRKLARRGFPRLLHQGSLGYAPRIDVARPESAGQARLFAFATEWMEPREAGSLRHLATGVHRLRP